MSQPPTNTAPPTILSVVHTLHSQLTSLYPTLSTHPTHPISHLHSSLSTPPTSKLPLISSGSIIETFKDIRSSLESFQSSFLSHNVNPSNNNTTKLGIDKYLSLLSELSMLSSIDLDLEREKDQRSSALARMMATRETSAGSIMNLVHSLPAGTPQVRSIALVEAISHPMGWVSFQEPTSDGGDGIVLSLGGKVMVVDFEVSGEGGVRKVKISYSLPNTTGGAVMESEGGNQEVGGPLEVLDYAKRLEDLSGAIQSLVASNPTTITARTTQVASTGLFVEKVHQIREIMKELKRLDQWIDEDCSERGRDGFAFSEKFVKELTERLAEDMNSTAHRSPAPQIIEHSISLTSPRLLYYTSQSANSSSTTADSTPTPTLNSTFEAHISLVPPTSLPEQSTSIISASESASTFLATFKPSVIITKAVGRRITRAITQLHSESGVDTSTAEVESRDRTRVGRRGAGGEITTFEDLLISSARVGSEAETTSLSIRLDASSQFIIPKSHDLPAQHYSLANAGEVRGYLCEEIRFSTLNQLFAALEILKEQLLFNELVKSVINPINLQPVVKAPLATNFNAHKRRKLSDTITLDELFGPSDKLPIGVHLNPNGTPLSISISFPSSHTPLAFSFPIFLSICVRSEGGESGNLAIEISGKGAGMEMFESEDVRSEARQCLESTRSVPKLVDWVLNALSKA